MGVLQEICSPNRNTVYSEAYSVDKNLCLEHAFKEQLWLGENDIIYIVGKNVSNY